MKETRKEGKKGQKGQTEEKKLMTTVDDERRGNPPKIVSPSKSSEALKPGNPEPMMTKMPADCG